VCSHLGGAGGGAFPLLSFFHAIDAARLRLVCQELRDMEAQFCSYKRREDSSWQWPLPLSFHGGSPFPDILITEKGLSVHVPMSSCHGGYPVVAEPHLPSGKSEWRLKVEHPAGALIGIVGGASPDCAFFKENYGVCSGGMLTLSSSRWVCGEVVVVVDRSGPTVTLSLTTSFPSEWNEVVTNEAASSAWKWHLFVRLTHGTTATLEKQL